MRLLQLFFVAYLAAVVTAWGLPTTHNVPAYNNWDSNDLTRWLNRHSIKHSRSQTKDELLGLVRKNWNADSVPLFASWSNEQLGNYLRKKQVRVSDATANNREWLMATVRHHWDEINDSAEYAASAASAWTSWLFGTGSESAYQRLMDSVRPASAQASDSAVAAKGAAASGAAAGLNKAKELYGSAGAAAYSGSSWLFDAWSDSDLHNWLVAHGHKVPTSSTRASLIASIRKYTDEAAKGAQDVGAKVEDRLADFKHRMFDHTGQIKDSAFNSWSESDLKRFLDAHGVDVPQPTKKDELIALARRNKHLLAAELRDTSAAASAKGASLLHAGKVQVAETGEHAQQLGKDAFKQVVDSWSDSRMRQFLKARGILPTEQTKTERLKELVFQHRNRGVQGYGAWSFDSWSTDELKAWLKQQGQSARGSRDQLIEQSAAYLASAKHDGSVKYNMVTSKLADLVAAGKEKTFESWSTSDLKAYLDTYGVKTYQGSNKNELVAAARRNARLFTHGADPDSWTRAFGAVHDSVVGAFQSVTGMTKKLSEKTEEHVEENLKRSSWLHL
ncbi:uncharacterized protein V1510DRAFT_400493 [Dipodascopsis tothii]|uniref:uncharacterized protein n=1 Tax=Dipodascopsis tothii TaxID=44089 RepID=UPI0034CF29BB